MATTQPTGRQIKDATIQRVDLDTVTVGQAVITKLIAGTYFSLSATGADAGTGDVTISLVLNTLAAIILGQIMTTGDSSPEIVFDADGSLMLTGP